MLTQLSLLIATALTPPLPDLIPAGHHRVKNEVVFVESGALASVRLVAAPAAGFGGVEEIVAGRPFPYSRKYGTRVYVVPHDLELSFPDSFQREDWPSSTVEISGSVVASDISPIHGRLTTVRLVGVTASSIELERVAQMVSDEHGQPVHRGLLYLYAAGLAALGFVLLWTLQRSRSQAASSVSARAEDH